MRKAIFLILLTLFGSSVYAQVGNEWIKFNQVYYKIPTAKDGIYRLTQADLINAGLPSGVDPRRLQLFHRGVEQAIYVAGQDDGVLGPTDYLEFYGLRNDGTLDTDLYTPSSLQPHPYYNLFNDTTAYFLTYNLTTLGKRMAASNEINVTNIPKDTYHFDEKLMILSNTYSAGYTEGDYFQSSSYDEGEGWTGALIREGQHVDYTITDVVNGEPSGGLPQLEVLLVGRGFMSHSVEVSVGASSASLRVVATPGFSAFATYKVEESIDWSDISATGNVVVRVRTIGVNGSSDRISASYIKLRYPQQYNASSLTEKVFNAKPNVSNKSYIEVQNYPVNAQLLDITDPANPVRIRTLQNVTLNAVIPNTSAGRKLILSTNYTTPAVKPVNFRSIDANVEYVVISHRALMKPALGYGDVVKAFAGYRSSEAGGGYDTLVVDIQQLYDQFNYGEISPRAIRKFMQYLVNSNVPDYLFIIGKGLEIWENYYRRPELYTTYKSLVPASGYPASDNFFTAGMNGTTYEAAVPTGRLTAMKPEQVAAYLNKVIELEAKPFDALWRKDLLHLSGGVRSFEPPLFKQFMEGFQQVAEDNYLGGKVTAIAKQSTEIELLNVSDVVNKGLNLVTFYGHSAPGILDFDIGFVTNPVLGYNNPGKYPMFLVNGCNAGAFFLNSIQFGEDWVMAENKGAIGFIAHGSYGQASTLKRYADYFYEIGYGDSVFIKRGIGDIQQEVARQYMESAAPTVTNIGQVQQMLLLGDPAVRLFGAKKTDYQIDEQSLSIESFDGNPVTAVSDSFAVQIIVRNFGITSKDNLQLRVTRTFSDNTTVTYDSLFSPVLYSDTLTFIIRKDESTGFGVNSFTVEIDPNNAVDELSEDNNIATIDFFIPSNGTKHLYPYDYAIVSHTQVDLRFQTTDLFSANREFLVEVDTVNTFDSPYKQAFTTSGAVLAIQSLSLLSDDSLAYYWRTRLADPLPGESEEWVTTTFTYIQDSPPGWAQIHFPQYLRNESIGLVKDPVIRELRFEETMTDIFIKNFGSANPATNLDVSVQLNGAEYQITSTPGSQAIPCRKNTINLIAFDKTTSAPYAGIPFLWQDTRTCGRAPQVIVSYTVAQLEISGAGIAEYIDNIEAGDSVVLFSIGDAGYASWSATVKTKLGEIGIAVAQIDALQPGEPVVIFARKGAAPGTAVFHRTAAMPANQQELQVNGSVTGRFTSGRMTSVLIGPAEAWQQLVSTLETQEINDDAYLDVKGVDLQGNETSLLSGVTGTIDLSGIDATENPYLRLEYFAEDELNLTAAQLEKWLVLYTPVAEGMIYYEAPPEQVSLFEGESWSTTYGFVNISDQSFGDSLTVMIDVYNKTSRVADVSYQKIKAPLPGDTTFFSVGVNTVGKGGLNNLSVTVNPRLLPEQYYDNNFLRFTDLLDVEADGYKPVMDVTIDGRYVLNGDYVSANPEIKLRLWDENRFALKTDTTGVTLFLSYPCEAEECPLTPIYFSRADVTWHAATDTSDFIVYFKPTNLPVGHYLLRAQAADSRGNIPDDEPYDVAFLVDDESSVMLMAPHPNPSSRHITFNLIISGNEEPDYAHLQVITPDGRVIREMKESRLFVGSNEIIWDGKNDQQQDVPAGLYFYKLTIIRDGTTAAIGVPSQTQYFKNGYGKVVIVR